MIPPISFLQSPYQNARDTRYPLRAVVSHRIVGTLPSARRAFGIVVGDPGRSASSHFGIGFVNGVLAVDQYVPLDRMAWTNGDVRDPTWPLYQPGVNPNLTTVTIEHEDGGYPGLGVLQGPVWQASMELQRLLVSGDGPAIRAAGIRGATDAMVAQMARISKDTTGFIDHHQIAGPNKPYCLRRWLDDPGFVEGSPSRRDRLLASLGAPSEDDMKLLPSHQALMQGRLREETGIARLPLFDAELLVTRPAGTQLAINHVMPGQGPYTIDGVVGNEWLAVEIGDEIGYVEAPYVVDRFITAAGQKVVPPSAPTGFTQRQLDEAKAATANKAEAKTQAWIATRPPIVP
jgi:hypothetical protein